MKEQIRENLKTLTGLIGVSGAEQEVVEYLRDQFLPIADEVTVTTLGNIIAVKKGSKPGPSLMIAAHSDEVGFCVKTILKDGFICFEKVGSASDKIAPGRKVWIKTQNGRIPGVIGVNAAHLQTEEQKKRVQTSAELFLDVAASSREELEKMGIKVGDRFVIQNDFMEMANSDFVCTKAIDNRINCAVLLQLFKEIKDLDFGGTIYGVVTVQEEGAYAGGKVVGNIVQPDYAIITDTVPCIDTPDCIPEKQQPIWLGKGPVCVVDYGTWVGVCFHYIHPQIRKMFEAASEKTNVPIQYVTSLESSYATDAPEIVSSYKGIPAATLSVPRRYSHSPIELMNLNDAVGVVKILTEIVSNNQNATLNFI